MGKLFITGRIIDGTGKEPISDGVVVINGNKIEQVGSKKKIQIPKDAKVIAAGDSTIMPGLIDAHLHLMGATGLNSVLWAIEEPLVEAMRVTTALEPLIYAGFTSVRDVGGLGI